MTKKQVMEKLDELEIEYDPNANKAELEALLEKGVPKEEKKEERDEDEGPRPLPQGLKRVKVNSEELKKLQDDGELVGFDPSTSEAIIKK